MKYKAFNRVNNTTFEFESWDSKVTQVPEALRFAEKQPVEQLINWLQKRGYKVSVYQK